MVEVAIVGAAGYAGAEAVRWVLGHPELSLAAATSGADEGRRIADVYPALNGVTEARFTAPDADSIADVAGVAILAVPHTASLALTPALLTAGVTVIDLSADYRLTDPGLYAKWYGETHTSPELLGEAVYGLPEVDRSGLFGARLVAGPGCYPTASILAAAPAMSAGVWDGMSLRVDAKSGVSGAGRAPSATSHFVSANESLMPYKVGTHRHTPEIEQGLSRAAGTDVRVLFTPHLIPMSRGLLATVYIGVRDGFTSDDAVSLYRDCYRGEPFIYVHDAGTMPSTAEVRGTNRAALGVHVDARTGTLVAVCAIDNLGKGAAGQGIQCLNAVMGFPEVLGLTGPAAVV